MKFTDRHIGPSESEIQEMLKSLGAASLEELTNRIVPKDIRLSGELGLSSTSVGSEAELLAKVRELAAKNIPVRALLGGGYGAAITPPVIQRLIFENPGWYTQYTPYQAEISQGRLEALLNFQTVVSDLTGLPIANASLLDEGTAAAEAMTLLQRVAVGERKKFFVDEGVFDSTKAILTTRAAPLAIELVFGAAASAKLDESFFGLLIQYPEADGRAQDWRAVITRAHGAGIKVCAASCLMALVLLKPPGEWGVDVMVGNTQRFGVPLFFGGPHAAYMAVRDEYARQLPGRLIGVSKDATGKSALRLALQVREQHIRRDKATSNICTSQVLLAVAAGMYAVYHGPDGLREIAAKISSHAKMLGARLKAGGSRIIHESFFDTLRFIPPNDAREVLRKVESKGILLRDFGDGSLGITVDELFSPDEGDIILAACRAEEPAAACESFGVSANLRRTSEFLKAKVFNSYHSETEFMRYVKRLESRDLSLTTSMIPLGSCTMKLNAAVEMAAVTWPEFAGVHPRTPDAYTAGYRELIGELSRMLCDLTGLSGCSLQPNAGSQGEYAGLLAIRRYLFANGHANRKICLIPDSAHGTNPASAVLAGMQVVSVKCTASGDVDLVDLKEKAALHAEDLAALMVTYPSTHGVFEKGIRELCEIVHQAGGQVYLDGANMNAQVGVTRPSDYGVDVCHLNLHKTFCIPHGGGGPGVGPICVAEHLVPYLPGDPCANPQSGAVSSANFGSAGVLVIPWAYIKLMGVEGLTRATRVAMLNANYIAKRLAGAFEVLYRGEGGLVAHECILDLRWMKKTIGVEVQDVAKRLMDYGFHAPTVSFPVVETLMVEPTESESKAELDRFCDALLSIREEIRAVENGLPAAESPLKHAPHTAECIASADWSRSYSRDTAVYPLPYLRDYKYWPPVARIDNAYGDRNLFCSCG